MNRINNCRLCYKYHTSEQRQEIIKQKTYRFSFQELILLLFPPHFNEVLIEEAFALAHFVHALETFVFGVLLSEIAKRRSGIIKKQH